jgi:hypothetical protein
MKKSLEYKEMLEKGKKKGHEEDSLQSGRNLPSCIVREPLKYST